MIDIEKKSRNVWSLGAYNEIAIFALPVSAHLVRLCNISSNDHILDVACGTGNTAITASLMTGAKVSGVDFTPELLAIAKEEASIAEEAGDIDWREGNVQDLPFRDEYFDVVLSSFGHMFALNPEIAIHEMIRVTKRGGSIAFSTWPPELANGRLFEALAKHMPSSPSSTNSPASESSPMLWGIPEVIQKRLGSNSKVKNIHFERGVVNKPILSPNHWWKMASTKSGSLIQAIQTLKEPQKVESLKKDILQAIMPYIHENVLNLDYLVTVAIKA